MKKCRESQRGASVVHWLLALVALGAFAVDVNNVYVSNAELQKAADAGALEGARILLYTKPNDSTVYVNTSGYTDAQGNSVSPATGAATAAAEANTSQHKKVEAFVQRGHWRFCKNSENCEDSKSIDRGGVFTPNSNGTSAPLINSSVFREFMDKNNDPSGLPSCDGLPVTSHLGVDLNSDTCVVNAVKVVAQRKSTPIQAFLGGVLGIKSYQASATAVAYIGFAGSANPGDIDAPMAICLQSVFDGTNYSCSKGLWQSTGVQDLEWSDLSQVAAGANCPKPGNGVGNAVTEMKVCGGSGILYTTPRIIGLRLTTTNGTSATDINTLENTCWEQDSSLYSSGTVNTTYGPDKPLSLKLPLIDCPSGLPPGSCNTLLGALTVRVLWINGSNDNQVKAGHVPYKMTGVSPFPDWDWLQNHAACGKNDPMPLS